MSVFNDYIESADDILLQTYDFHHEEEGDYLTPIQNTWDYFGDTYYDINEAWYRFIWGRKRSINYTWRINITSISKSAWLNALKKELRVNRIKTHEFRGRTFYNAADLVRFCKNYELMIVWRYCRYHKVHWDGQHIVLTNEDNTESYEYIQWNEH